MRSRCTPCRVFTSTFSPTRRAYQYQTVPVGRAAELGNDAARHILDSRSERVPEFAPQGYVSVLFDDYSTGFEKYLVEDLNHRVPWFSQTRHQAVPPAGTHFVDVVDLGCGAGLVGVELRPLAERLTGADLSPGMLGRARKKRIFDALVQLDITDFLVATEERHDLFTAGDLII